MLLRRACLVIDERSIGDPAQVFGERLKSSEVTKMAAALPYHSNFAWPAARNLLK